MTTTNPHYHATKVNNYLPDIHDPENIVDIDAPGFNVLNPKEPKG